MHTNVICRAVVELLSRPRQMFGCHVTVQNGDRDILIHTNHIKVTSLTSESAFQAQGVLEAVSDFGMTIKFAEAATNSVVFCTLSDKTAARDSAILARIGAMEETWASAEFAAYQAHRVEMGLAPLQAGEPRSHWDEPMRLKYRERFGPDRYAEVRAETLRAKERAFQAMQTHALEEHAEAEQRECKEWATVTDPTTVVFEAVPPMHFIDIVAKLLQTYTSEALPTQVVDAISGNAWQLSASGRFQVCAHTSGDCAMPFFLPRNPSCTAAQQLADKPSHALFSLLLNDADIETMTRRFYGGKTFLFHTIQENSHDQRAMQWAFNSNVDGENTDRNVFFVLAQVLYNLKLEMARDPEDPATRDIYTFMMDFWQLTFVVNAHLYNRSNSFLGLKIDEFMDLLKIEQI